MMTKQLGKYRELVVELSDIVNEQQNIIMSIKNDLLEYHAWLLGEVKRMQGGGDDHEAQSAGNKEDV